LLHQVFGFVPIPFEPQRETEQPIGVRQGFRLKGGPRMVVGGGRWLRGPQSPVRAVLTRIMSLVRLFIPCHRFSRHPTKQPSPFPISIPATKPRLTVVRS